MNIDKIAIGNNPPHDVNVIVEVPTGGQPIKYEMDKASGAMVVDRMLYTAMRYPGNYGFVPHTLSDDGDPIDVLIANELSLVPGAVINCKPIGVLYMTDEAGGDEKVVAVPSEQVSAKFKDVNSVFDLPEITRDQIAHFFEHYKDLESKKWVKIERWGGPEDARDMIEKAVKAAG